MPHQAVKIAKNNILYVNPSNTPIVAGEKKRHIYTGQDVRKNVNTHAVSQQKFEEHLQQFRHF